MSNGLALLAEYSDSDSEVENESPPLKKKKLHNPVKDLKIGVELPGHEVEDDPGLHDNRVRSFAHVRGNWASYIYLETIDLQDLQKSIILALEPVIDLTPISDPHLSLSRVFTLQHHLIPHFTGGLRDNLKALKDFSLSFDGIKTFVNEEKTRTFVAASIRSVGSLKAVLKACDDTLIEFDKEKFYDPADFHVSLAWSLGDQSKIIQDQILNKCWQDWTESGEDTVFHVSKVNCKIGNKFFSFPLDKH